MNGPLVFQKIKLGVIDCFNIFIIFVQKSFYKINNSNNFLNKENFAFLWKIILEVFHNSQGWLPLYLSP